MRLKNFPQSIPIWGWGRVSSSVQILRPLPLWPDELMHRQACSQYWLNSVMLGSHGEHFSGVQRIMWYWELNLQRKCSNHWRKLSSPQNFLIFQNVCDSYLIKFLEELHNLEWSQTKSFRIHLHLNKLILLVDLVLVLWHSREILFSEALHHYLSCWFCFVLLKLLWVCAQRRALSHDYSFGHINVLCFI